MRTMSTNVFACPTTRNRSSTCNYFEMTIENYTRIKRRRRKKRKKKKEEEKEIKKMKKKSRAFVSSVMGEQKFTDNNNKETI